MRRTLPPRRQRSAGKGGGDERVAPFGLGCVGFWLGFGLVEGTLAKKIGQLHFFFSRSMQGRCTTKKSFENGKVRFFFSF